MALKPRYKRRIFWTSITLVGLCLVAVVLAPYFITLNKLKPRIQSAIYEQTGIDAQINGDVHFSLLAGATIVVRDINIPVGKIGATVFRVPVSYLFDLENAPLTQGITIYNADLKIDSLIPIELPNAVSINNSYITFKDKKYEVIRATLADGQLMGTVRTNDHKYDITFDNDEFSIRNQNNNLEISGQLYSDGTARGELAIKTNKINEWFEFKTPNITDTIDMTMNFHWDGSYGFDFTNIQANDFTGNIYLRPSGYKVIELRSDNLDYDFSFLLKPDFVYTNTSLNLDFMGKLKLGNHVFHRLRVNASGDNEKLSIKNISADEISITGGYIDANGAHNILISVPYRGTTAVCMFSGTPNSWHCSSFVYGNMSGKISVNGDEYDIAIDSSEKMPSKYVIDDYLKLFGTHGRVRFAFSNIAGTMTVQKNGKTSTEYIYAKNKPLSWAVPNLPFLPDFMLNATGNFKWQDGIMEFRPYGGKWNISLSDNFFVLSGKDGKELLPDIDLQSLNPLPYTISGVFSGANISNMTLKVGTQEFTGSVSGNKITLKTQVLNLDEFINSEYVDNYAELEFLSNSPILIPFDVPVSISLSADRVIYNGDEYANFVYALKPAAQIFSISDSLRGNMLTTIEQRGTEYDISVQLNKFKINGYLLSRAMPLNIRDSMVTAEMDLHTSGMIAHDITYNMHGTLDLSFEGGVMDGIGIDNLFAAADEITSLNAEYILSDALDGGSSVLKTMRLVGEYKNGDFHTTAPLQLQLRHTDAVGEMEISNGQMAVALNMILRGTAPTPAPVNLVIAADGTRSYSLSEIMINLDPSYMRSFVKTHDKF